jgi:hypothetical protein
MRRPGDPEPDTPEGRAAERLKEFLRERAPVESPSTGDQKADEETHKDVPES